MRLLVIVRMHMGIPASASRNTKPERVIFGNAKVVRTSFVQKGQSPGGESIPSMGWDQIESGLQLLLKPGILLTRPMYV
jgi:hypothetical protein